MEEKLKIFGSYEDSVKNTQQIIGHDNTSFIVGGNARNNVRSNIIDWNLTKKFMTNKNVSDERVEKMLIEQINIILNLKTFVNDKSALCEIIDKVLALDAKSMLRFFETSLDLKEAIVIELRRLFYVIADLIDDETTKFCPYEPVKRIRALTGIHDIWINDVELENFDNINAELRKLVNLRGQINDLFEIFMSRRGSSKISNAVDKQPQHQDPLMNKMDNFIKLYVKIFKHISAVEKLNIAFAQKIGEICTLLESIRDSEGF